MSIARVFRYSVLPSSSSTQSHIAGSRCSRPLSASRLDTSSEVRRTRLPLPLPSSPAHSSATPTRLRNRIHLPRRPERGAVLVPEHRPRVGRVARLDLALVLFAASGSPSAGGVLPRGKQATARIEWARTEMSNPMRRARALTSSSGNSSELASLSPSKCHSVGLRAVVVVPALFPASAHHCP